MFNQNNISNKFDLNWSTTFSYKRQIRQHWGQFHQHFYVRLFRSIFWSQIIVTCKWQPAQLCATCEWHNQHNFHTKKHCEICFKKQAAFLSFEQKAAHKHVDEIDAWLHWHPCCGCSLQL
jgi:hypothetical protein